MLCISKAAYRHYRETTEVVAKARCRKVVLAPSIFSNTPAYAPGQNRKSCCLHTACSFGQALVSHLHSTALSREMLVCWRGNPPRWV